MAFFFFISLQSVKFLRFDRRQFTVNRRLRTLYYIPNQTALEMRSGAPSYWKIMPRLMFDDTRNDL